MKDELIQAILNGDEDLVINISRKMVKKGVKKQDIMDIFSNAGKIASKNSETGTMLIELLAVMTMQQSFKIFVEDLCDKHQEDSKKISIIIGSIFGDYHDLGKNMVKYCFTRLGYQVIDLGKSVTIETFISQASKFNADIIAVSASMNSTRLYIPLLTEAIQKNNIKAKLIIGGPVITKAYADKISANYSPDPFSAIEKIEEIVSQSTKTD